MKNFKHITEENTVNLRVIGCQNLATLILSMPFSFLLDLFLDNTIGMLSQGMY